jgi:hypothetical protein
MKETRPPKTGIGEEGDAEDTTKPNCKEVYFLGSCEKVSTVLLKETEHLRGYKA